MLITMTYFDHPNSPTKHRRTTPTHDLNAILYRFPALPYHLSTSVTAGACSSLNGARATLYVTLPTTHLVECSQPRLGSAKGYAKSPVLLPLTTLHISLSHSLLAIRSCYCKTCHARVLAIKLVDALNVLQLEACCIDIL